MRLVLVLTLIFVSLVLLKSPVSEAKGSVSCETQLSGGDLRAPVGISREDCANALWRTGGSFELGTPPDVSGTTAYQLQQGSEFRATYSYYPRPNDPGVIHCPTCDGGRQWSTAESSFDRTYRRYLALARAGLISGAPTWSAVMRASAQLWPAEVQISRSGSGEPLTLAGQDAMILIDDLTTSRPVSVGFRDEAGRPVSSRLNYASLTIRFGDFDELSFAVIPPGGLHARAVIFDGLPPSIFAVYQTPLMALVDEGYLATRGISQRLEALGISDESYGLEVRIAPIPRRLQEVERKVTSISVMDNGGGTATIDVHDEIEPDDLFSSLYSTSPVGDQATFENQMALIFNLDVRYTPFPEGYSPIQADYYPETGDLFIRGIPLGNGRLGPGWAKASARLIRAVDPIATSWHSESTSDGAGDRVVFIGIGVGLLAVVAVTTVTVVGIRRRYASV